MTAPPAEMIGRLGEYFALKWLEKDGFEVRRLWDFYLKLKFGAAERFEREEFVPEDERRRRLAQSYEARIPMLQMRLAEAERQANPSRKVKNWITLEREHLRLMKQALTDVKEGKPLESVTEYPAEYPIGSRRYHSEPWRVYEEVETDSEAREFLGAKADDFVKYLDECDSLSRAELGGTMLPDIVARKGGDIFIIEVKANDADLAALQRRALDLAAEHGFRVKVIRVRFDAHCSEEEVWKRRPGSKVEN